MQSIHTPPQSSLARISAYLFTAGCILSIFGCGDGAGIKERPPKWVTLSSGKNIQLTESNIELPLVQRLYTAQRIDGRLATRRAVFPEVDGDTENHSFQHYLWTLDALEGVTSEENRLLLTTADLITVLTEDAEHLRTSGFRLQDVQRTEAVIRLLLRSSQTEQETHSSIPSSVISSSSGRNPISVTKVLHNLAEPIDEHASLDTTPASYNRAVISVAQTEPVPVRNRRDDTRRTVPVETQATIVGDAENPFVAKDPNEKQTSTTTPNQTILNHPSADDSTSRFPVSNNWITTAESPFHLGFTNGGTPPLLIDQLMEVHDHTGHFSGWGIEGKPGIILFPELKEKLTSAAHHLRSVGRLDEAKRVEGSIPELEKRWQELVTISRWDGVSIDGSAKLHGKVVVHDTQQAIDLEKALGAASSSSKTAVPPHEKPLVDRIQQIAEKSPNPDRTFRPNGRWAIEGWNGDYSTVELIEMLRNHLNVLNPCEERDRTEQRLKDLEKQEMDKSRLQNALARMKSINAAERGENPSNASIPKSPFDKPLYQRIQEVNGAQLVSPSTDGISKLRIEGSDGWRIDGTEEIYSNAEMAKLMLEEAVKLRFAGRSNESGLALTSLKGLLSLAAAESEEANSPPPSDRKADKQKVQAQTEQRLAEIQQQLAVLSEKLTELSQEQARMSHHLSADEARELFGPEMDQLKEQIKQLLRERLKLRKENGPAAGAAPGSGPSAPQGQDGQQNAKQDVKPAETATFPFSYGSNWPIPYQYDFEKAEQALLHLRQAIEHLEHSGKFDRRKASAEAVEDLKHRAANLEGQIQNQKELSEHSKQSLRNGTRSARRGDEGESDGAQLEREIQKFISTGKREFKQANEKLESLRRSAESLQNAGFDAEAQSLRDKAEQVERQLREERDRKEHHLHELRERLERWRLAGSPTPTMPSQAQGPATSVVVPQQILHELRELREEVRQVRGDVAELRKLVERKQSAEQQSKEKAEGQVILQREPGGAVIGVDRKDDAKPDPAEPKKREPKNETKPNENRDSSERDNGAQKLKGMTGTGSQIGGPASVDPSPAVFLAPYAVPPASRWDNSRAPDFGEPAPSGTATREEVTELDEILGKWEQESQRVRILTGDYYRWDYDKAMVVERRGMGTVTFDGANLGRVTLEPRPAAAGEVSRATNATGTPMKIEVLTAETVIWNEGQVFVVDGNSGMVRNYTFPQDSSTESSEKIPSYWQQINPMNQQRAKDGWLPSPAELIPFAFGVRAEEIAERYSLRIVRRAGSVVTIEAMPRLKADAEIFQKLLVQLDLTTWLPVALKCINTRGDYETVYRFSNWSINPAFLPNGKGTAAIRSLSPQEQQVETALRKPVSLNFTEESLPVVMGQIGKLANTNVVIDGGLKEAGIDANETKFSLQVDGIPLSSALNLLLEPKGLAYVVGDDVLKITSAAKALEHYQRRGIAPSEGAQLMPPTGPVLLPNYVPAAQPIPQGSNNNVQHAPPASMTVTGPGVTTVTGPAGMTVTGTGVVVQADPQRGFPAMRVYPTLDANSVEKHLLTSRVTMHMTNSTLYKILMRIGAQVNVRIAMDNKSLETVGTKLDERTFSIDVEKVPAADALKQLLEPLKLSYVVERGAVVIMTDDAAKGKLLKLR